MKAEHPHFNNTMIAAFQNHCGSVQRENVFLKKYVIVQTHRINGTIFRQILESG